MFSFFKRKRYNKYLTNLVFSVRTVTYESSFFPLRLMARALHAFAINRRGKISVRNLPYGPRTWLVRSMYFALNRNYNSTRSKKLCNYDRKIRMNIENCQIYWKKVAANFHDLKYTIRNHFISFIYVIVQFWHALLI